jgi:hypothetical protein
VIWAVRSGRNGGQNAEDRSGNVVEYFEGEALQVFVNSELRTTVEFNLPNPVTRTNHPVEVKE